jgi:hypothetical protein
VLPRDQTQPGGLLATVLELGGVTDSRDERGGRHRSNPWDSLQPLTL